MVFGLIILVLSHMTDLVISIECYQCQVKSSPRSPLSPAPEFEPLCSQFDGSDDFLVNCTQSTFCMTRTYRLHHRLGGAPVTIEERGCAQQVYTYQNLDRGQWRTVTTILEDTYTPGCIKDREWAEHLATDTEWCYCDTDRCNDNIEDVPQYSDYQDNFIESNGLKVSSNNIAESDYYNISDISKSDSVSKYLVNSVKLLTIIIYFCIR